jgi:hypothetical protein
MAKTRLASDAITRAGILLADVASTRWAEATRLLWISEAQLAITILDPRATRTTVTLALSAGYRQSLPADALAMLDGTYNGAGGVVTPVRVRQQLDLEDPGWTAAVGDANAQHLIPPQPGEKDFIIYPVQPAVPGTLEITYSKNPVDITASTDTLGIEDEYFTALVNYLVYRAQQQDDDNMQEVSTSDKFYQAFIAAMPYQAGAA